MESVTVKFTQSMDFPVTRFNFKYKLLQSPSPRSLDLIKPKFLSQTQTTQMKSDEFCFSAPVPPPKKQSGWLKDFNIGSSLASYSCQLKKDRIAFMVDVPANKRQQDEPKAVEKTVISSHQEETRGEPLSSLQVPDDFFGDLKLLKSKADQEIPDALKTRMGAILMSVGNNEEMIKITEENCDMNNIGDIKEVEKEKKKSVADHYFDVCTKISAKSDLSIVAAVVEFAEVDEDMPENRPAEINSVKEAASVAEENFGCEKDHSSSVNSIIKSNIVDTTSTDSAEPSLEANDKFETEKLSIELAGTAENLDVPFESVKDHPAKSEIPLLKLGDYAAEEIEKIVVPYEEKIDEISQNDSPVALTQIPVVSVHDVIVSITSEKQAALKTIHEEVEPTSVTNCEQSGQSFAQQIVTDVSSTDVSAEKKSFPLCEKFATNQLEAPLTQTKKSSLPQMVVCPTFSASQLVTSDLAQDKMSRTNSELIDLFSPSCFKIPVSIIKSADDSVLSK